MRNGDQTNIYRQFWSISSPFDSRRRFQNEMKYGNDPMADSRSVARLRACVANFVLMMS